MMRYLNDIKKVGDVPSTRQPPLLTSVSSAPSATTEALSPTTVETLEPPHPLLGFGQVSPQPQISMMKNLPQSESPHNWARDESPAFDQAKSVVFATFSKC